MSTILDILLLLLLLDVQVLNYCPHICMNGRGCRRTAVGNDDMDCDCHSGIPCHSACDQSGLRDRRFSYAHYGRTKCRL